MLLCVCVRERIGLHARDKELNNFSLFCVQNKLTKKFRIQGIPRLVILDGETGKTITVDGFNHLMEDENGCAFPWKRKPFWEMIKGKLLHGDKQEEVDAMEALKGKIIGLYFAANWVRHLAIGN